MREDRQREVVRSIGHLEGLKYQLLSVLAPEQRLNGVSGSDQGAERPNSSQTVSGSHNRLPHLPPKFSNTEEVPPVSEIKAMKSQVETLCEEVGLSISDL